MTFERRISFDLHSFPAFALWQPWENFIPVIIDAHKQILAVISWAFRLSAVLCVLFGQTSEFCIVDTGIQLASFIPVKVFHRG